MADKNYKMETLALHAGQPVDTDTLSRAVPIYRTSSYMFKSTEHAANLFALKEPGNIYSRIMNPTQDVLEKRMAAIEGGKASLALASGTTAIYYSIINICAQGDEIVSSNKLYGGTYTMFADIFPQFGIKVHFVDPSDPKNFEKAITPNTKLLFTETIGNPSLDFADIGAIAKIAHKNGMPLLVDSTFTPPTIFRPIEHGADIVIHSLTKWIGGHGTAIGGIVIDAGKFDWQSPKFKLLSAPEPGYHNMRFAYDLGDANPLAFIMRLRLVPLRNLGACISPDNSWMFIQGIETLALRMERHCENAMKVAQFLKGHKKVSWVRYPGLKDDPSYATAEKYLKKGFGGMVVFGVNCSRNSCSDFIEKLELFSHLANVGDAKSLAIHPATTTHSQLSDEDMIAGGITPDLIRLSIGIENSEDIIADLEQALAKI